MAKIGTAHIEIKPVIDEAALKVIEDRVAQAVAAGVARGMRSIPTPYVQPYWTNPVTSAGQITVTNGPSVTTNGPRHAPDCINGSKCGETAHCPGY